VSVSRPFPSAVRPLGGLPSPVLIRIGAAWVGKAERFAVNMPDQGWTYDFTGRNAIQSEWMIDYRGDDA